MNLFSYFFFYLTIFFLISSIYYYKVPNIMTELKKSKVGIWSKAKWYDADIMADTK